VQRFIGVQRLVREGDRTLPWEEALCQRDLADDGDLEAKAISVCGDGGKG
jgi:hypothetical protein